MSVELSDLFHAAASHEAAAAEREFPLTQTTVAGYVRAARRRRVVGVALVATVGAIVIGAGLLGLSELWQGAPIATTPTPSATWSASVSPSNTPSPTPTTVPSQSATPSESPTPAATQTSPPATSPAAPVEPPAVVAPGQVTVVSAGAGGGSGETVVGWGPVEGATGYRVYRSSSADGSFAPAASFVVVTGATTVELGGSYEFIQIWQAGSGRLEYVESVDNARAYFTVAAFNAGGTGPRSGVVCGSPITAAEGC